MRRDHDVDDDDSRADQRTDDDVGDEDEEAQAPGDVDRDEPCQLEPRDALQLPRPLRSHDVPWHRQPLESRQLRLEPRQRRPRQVTDGARAGYAPPVIRELLEARASEDYELYARTINPQFMRVLKTIGF